jgi:ferric-dicitrate binding protein FerR (iron transport regulator)
MDQELLFRYITGDASDDEKIAVIDWIEEDPSHLKEIQTLRRLYDIDLWQDHREEHTNQNPSKPNLLAFIRKYSFEILKIAALVLVAMIGYFTFSGKIEVEAPAAMQTLYVPAGQRAEITLSDGTTVWLNARTTLTFPTRFSKTSRNVTLSGEGFFKVARNVENPFVVKTEKYDVRVLGTEFNVMAYPKSNLFEICLLEGSLEVSKPDINQALLLKPHDMVYLKGNDLMKKTIDNFNYFLWKDGIISFDNESFPDMVKKLELYFDLKILVKNESINLYRCTGKFRSKDGIEHILKVLQLNNQFNFKIDEKINNITIY